MGQSPNKKGSKESPSRIRKQPSELSKDTSKIGAAKSTKVGPAKAEQKMPEEQSNRRIGTGRKEDTSGFENNAFLLSAEGVLAKAMSLAQEASPKTSSNSTQAPGEASLDPAKEPETNEISIERLRDIINQHPDEFWRSEDSKPTREGTSITEKTRTTNPIYFEQTSPSNSQEKNDEESYNASEHVSKRRKLQHPASSPLPSPQTETTKRKDDPVFTTQDRQVLSAVQSLLEDSLQSLPSSKTENVAKDLLEQLKTKQSSAMEVDTDGISVQEMAHKVALSFANDLSGLLKAMNNAKSSVQDEQNKSELPSKKTSTSSKPTAIEASLLCDEQDLEILREDETTNENPRDDEILEILKDKNYVQQHLLCHENEEALFGKLAEEETSTSSDNDLLFVQKVALIRETKRLIRAKTLVLTKRRLGIQGEEDLII